MRGVYDYAYNAVIPNLTDIPLGLVNGAYLENLIRQVTKSAESYSKKVFELFNMSFNDVCERGDLSRNPMQDVSIKFPRKNLVIPQLTEKQIDTLLNVAKSEG